MALAGHNRGKKWVPGVGYRREVKPEPKRPKRKCTCGADAELYFSDGTVSCEACSYTGKPFQIEFTTAWYALNRADAALIAEVEKPSHTCSLKRVSKKGKLKR